MTTLAIILLVLFGVILILLEFFVVPGITVAGVGGLLLLGGSIYLAYEAYGSATGHILLGSIILATIILVTLALRSGTWKRIALSTTVDGKMNEQDSALFHEGDTGVAITRLAPMGKVEVNNKQVEAAALGELIDPETEIVVVKVELNKLIVKPKK
jgi:membrane-bound ClpP family serine protease